MGARCIVKTEQFTTVQGECSAGGHCKGQHGQVRFQHETCKVNKVREDVNKIERVKEFIRKNINMNNNVSKAMIREEIQSQRYENYRRPQIASNSECRGIYNPSVYTRLKKICTDCYNLFKEPEVYNYCMSGCFDSSFFFTCTTTLMIEEDMVRELVKIAG